MDLGLSGKEYLELAGRVDRIHHVAQVTYYGATKEMAEAVNIGAAREVIELGRPRISRRSSSLSAKLQEPDWARPRPKREGQANVTHQRPVTEPRRR